jgi:hypothetical protein
VFWEARILAPLDGGGPITSSRIALARKSAALAANDPAPNLLMSASFAHVRQTHHLAPPVDDDGPSRPMLATLPSTSEFIDERPVYL